MHFDLAKVTLLLSVLGLILWRHAPAIAIVFMAVVGVVSILAMALSVDVRKYFRRH